MFFRAPGDGRDVFLFFFGGGGGNHASVERYMRWACLFVRFKGKPTGKPLYVIFFFDLKENQQEHRGAIGVSNLKKRPRGYGVNLGMTCLSRLTFFPRVYDTCQSLFVVGVHAGTHTAKCH